MTPRTHVERYARRMPDGGIAWEYAVFNRLGNGQALNCLDAAVDLAWEMLMPDKALEFPKLAIQREGPLLVIRVQKDLGLAA